MTQHKGKGKLLQSRTTASKAMASKTTISKTNAATPSPLTPKGSVGEEKTSSITPASKVPEQDTPRSPLRRGVELIVAVLLAIGILCLLGTWGSALFVNLFLSSQPSASAGVHTVSLSPSDGTNGVPTEPAGSRIASSSDTAHATLIFTLEQVESVTPTRGSMTGVFDLTVPSEVSAAICDETGMTAVPDAQACGAKWSVTSKQTVCINNAPLTRYILKPAYTTQVLTLSIDRISHDPAFTTTQPLFSTTIPAKEFFLPPFPYAGAGCVTTNYLIGDSRHIHITTPVTLPLVSQGATYPSDWYQSAFQVLISLPSGWYIPNMVVGSGTLYYLPADLHVVMDTSMNHYRASVDQGTLGLAGSNIVNGPNLLLLQVTRTADLQWFVYSTAICIPLVLGLILGHGLWKRKEKESLLNVLLNVLIAIITVAAIRQILVPPDLQGLLTRLDLLLGLEGMLLLAIVCGTYVWKIIKPDQQEGDKSIATA